MSKREFLSAGAAGHWSFGKFSIARYSSCKFGSGNHNSIDKPRSHDEASASSSHTMLWCDVRVSCVRNTVLNIETWCKLQAVPPLGNIVALGGENLLQHWRQEQEETWICMEWWETRTIRYEHYLAYSCCS